MNELTRFLQQRNVQRLTGEEKKQLGLSVYPDEELTDLANELQTNGCDKQKSIQIIKKYLEKNNPEKLIEQMPQVINTLYQWLDYKAKPIKFQDFKDFVANDLTASFQGSNNTLPSSDDWKTYADLYIIALYTQQIDGVGEINYDLLLRSFYIIVHMVKKSSNKLTFYSCLSL